MTTIEQRIEALEQAVAAITDSLSRKQRMKLGFASADELNANIKIAAKDAIAFAKRVYGEARPLKVTGSFDYNSQTYVYEAEVRPLPENYNHIAKALPPDDSLIMQLFYGTSMGTDDCRNAIKIIANWLDSRYPAAKRLARVLRDQANQ